MNFTQETKYIIGAGLFAVVVFGFLIPNLASSINEQNVYTQFLIFNLGIFIFLQIFLKSFVTSTWSSVKTGIGIIALVMALDTWLPPLMVTTHGELLGNVPIYGAAVDYIWGYFATNTLHLTGFLVYGFTYIVMPIILLFISAKLLKNFVQHI